MGAGERHLKAGNWPGFYTSHQWQRLRLEVLADDKGECQICRAKGRYTRATHVHHINHVDKRPELALAREYTAADGTLRRNLISVCRNCHETVCHPERLPFNGREQEPPLTPERW